MTGFMRTIAAATGALMLVQAAPADVILDTGEPGGFFGYIGYDIFVGQSVGIAFTPTQDYTLDEISLWMMSNDFDAPGRIYTVTLRLDEANGNPTVPGETVIESWTVATTAVGWQPVLETVTSELHPTLRAGQSYWIVLESDEEGGSDPLWTWGSSSEPHQVGILDAFGTPGWEAGETFGSAPGTIINATPVASCTVDLNGDGLVDFSDYLEFLNLFDAQDLRVDYTGDGLVDFSDYLEFLNLFEAGC